MQESCVKDGKQQLDIKSNDAFAALTTASLHHQMAVQSFWWPSSSRSAAVPHAVQRLQHQHLVAVNMLITRT